MRCAKYAEGELKMLVMDVTGSGGRHTLDDIENAIAAMASADDTISKKDLNKALISVGIDISKQSLDTLFSHFDRYRDGVIDYKEFVRFSSSCPIKAGMLGTGPKKVTNGKSKIKNTTVSISVPVVNFVESPLKDTSSIHRVSVQNKHKDLEKLPSWKEYDSSNNSNDRTHSDSMSNDSRNSTSDAEYASSPAPGNTRQHPTDEKQED